MNPVILCMHFLISFSSLLSDSSSYLTSLINIVRNSIYSQYTPTFHGTTLSTILPSQNETF